ncbi:hypothetical protein HJG60_011570 [Phyllostomus discolor]|uniref:Uncharacterized protein n=1 Tax=Phyllostomus discolor TaxID=89673 RepID=A0A833ZW17_9CHIR|nr:hypothetical protein HJG60_011570 [Phyllostomus discolor]
MERGQPPIFLERRREPQLVLLPPWLSSARLPPTFGEGPGIPRPLFPRGAPASGFPGGVAPGARPQPSASRGTVALPASRSWSDTLGLAVLRVEGRDLAGLLLPGVLCSDPGRGLRPPCPLDVEHLYPFLLPLVPTHSGAGASRAFCPAAGDWPRGLLLSRSPARPLL